MATLIVKDFGGQLDVLGGKGRFTCSLCLSDFVFLGMVLRQFLFSLSLSSSHSIHISGHVFQYVSL